MSLPSIILGLLIWFSVPPFYAGALGKGAMRLLKLACKVAGIIFIVAGVMVGF